MAAVRMRRNASSSLSRSRSMRRPLARSITLRSSSARRSRRTSRKRATARSRRRELRPPKRLEPEGHDAGLQGARHERGTGLTSEQDHRALHAGRRLPGDLEGIAVGKLGRHDGDVRLGFLQEREGAVAAHALHGGTASRGEDGIAEGSAGAGIIIEHGHSPARGRRGESDPAVIRVESGPVSVHGPQSPGGNASRQMTSPRRPARTIGGVRWRRARVNAGRGSSVQTTKQTLRRYAP
jgi:hypothetical protein